MDQSILLCANINSSDACSNYPSITLFYCVLVTCVVYLLLSMHMSVCVHTYARTYTTCTHIHTTWEFITMWKVVFASRNGLFISPVCLVMTGVAEYCVFLFNAHPVVYIHLELFLDIKFQILFLTFNAQSFTHNIRFLVCA